MRRIASLGLLPIVLVTLGVGCGRDVSFIPAPQTLPQETPANIEGAHGSTGGQEATVTPNAATSILVSALPTSSKIWQGDQARELKQPVPLPDGTATEYSSATRDYRSADGKTIKIVMTDTRGIPALTAFIDSFQERKDTAGYRARIRLAEQDAWLSYAYGPEGEMDGQGSIVLLYRGRFLMQIDGEQGIGVDTLKAFASSIHFDTLN